MSENIKIGYIVHFCNHAHNEIDSAYESMCDEDEDQVVKILSDLKKFINETIKDYQSEIELRKNANHDNHDTGGNTSGRTESPCNRKQHVIGSSPAKVPE